ncbi:MAG: BatD family protein [candidate division Zixibacteria bacterium]|nr:BatD family protein [candidate division Zixibacteria bacterium]
MSKSLTTTLICAMVLIALGGATGVRADDDTVVRVSLDRDTIGMDEQVVLEIEVSGSIQDLPPPQMPTLSMFEVYSQGRSSNISIVNGQVSSSVTYRYLLLPTKPGTFSIDRVAVVYNNKRYKGNEVNLTVLKSGSSVSQQLEERATDEEGSTRDYFLEADVDKRSPFVNEQVTLTLKFYIGVQHYGSPELSEPTTTGFWTEILGNKAAYYQVVNNRKYKVIERKYALFPTQTGELTIGRATIRTTVAAKSRRRDPFDMFGDFFGRGVEVTARSQPIKLNVQPLPEEGRPADFTGTIGAFSLSAQADKREVEVNQPVTVTVRISGTGNIKSIAEPVIPQLDEFRAYKASTNESISKLKDEIGGAKIYEEVFIPRRPGDLEIPALKYSYFDLKSRQYKYLTTQPIRIKAIKPEGYAASADLPYASPDLTIGSRSRDIRYIKEDIGATSRPGYMLFVTPVYLVVNGVPVVLLASLILVRRRREKLAGNVGLARSQAASKMARKRLAKARSLAHPESAEEFFAEIRLALIAYIADKLNISPHGLTVDGIGRLVGEKTDDGALVEKLVGVLQKCDYARFAPASLTQQDVAESLAAAEDIMIKLEAVAFA